MAAFAPQVPQTPLPLPARHQQAGPEPALDRGPDADRSDVQPDAGPAAMTIAMVGETQARRGAAGVLDHLAELAVSDEMVVVFGSDDHPSGSGVQPVVAGLRHLLPRHTVVVLYAGPHDRPLWREATLLDELLEFGVLPVVVTPVAAVPDVAAELAHHLRADRIVRVAGDRPVSGPGPTCVRSAA